MRRFAILGFLSAVACFGAGKPAPWLRLTSPHFELLTTGSERAGRDLITHFEKVRAFFVQATGFAGETRPARIVAFRSDEEFAPYRPNEVAVAFYLGGGAHDYIVMKRASEELYKVATHEYTHLLIHQSGMRVPLWFNEGMAEFYSSVQAAGASLMVGKASAMQLETLKFEWIKLDAVVEAGHDSGLYNEEKRAGAFYAECWALVHLVMLDERYRPKAMQFVPLLEEQGTAAAFRIVYGKSLAEVESDLQHYIRGNQLNAGVFNLKWEKQLGEIRTEQEATLNARIALAEMQSGEQGKQEKGFAEFARLAAEFPASMEVRRDWAEALLYAGRSADAAREFAQAIKLGCSEPKALFDYARVLVALGESDEAESTLRKVLAAEPENREAHRELGIQLVQSGKYQEALAHLNRTGKVKPEDASRFFYYAAYANYRLENNDEARASLALARKYAKSDAALAPVESLERAVKERDARRADAAMIESAASSGEPAVDRAPLRPMEVNRPPRGEPLPSSAGQLRAVECAGKTARLRVTTGSQTQIFEIEDPEKITILSGGGKPVEFTCGPQKGERVRVEYLEANGKRLVRTLEFL